MLFLWKLKLTHYPLSNHVDDLHRLKVHSAFCNYGEQDRLLDRGQPIPQLCIKRVILSNDALKRLFYDGGMEGPFFGIVAGTKRVPAGMGQHLDVVWNIFSQIQDHAKALIVFLLGKRAMVAVIRMGREFGYAKLEASVVEALELGCTDVAAIRHLLMADQLQHASQQTIEIGMLAAYERPLPTMTEYNQLLSAGRIGVQA